MTRKEGRENQEKRTEKTKGGEQKIDIRGGEGRGGREQKNAIEEREGEWVIPRDQALADVVNSYGYDNLFKAGLAPRR